MKVLLLCALSLLALSELAQAQKAECPDKEHFMKIATNCLIMHNGRRRRALKDEVDLDKVSPCVCRCVIDDLELFNDDGTLKLDLTNAIIDDCIPKHAEFKDMLIKTKECINTHAGKMNGKDSAEPCASFQEFKDCFIG